MKTHPFRSMDEALNEAYFKLAKELVGNPTGYESKRIHVSILGESHIVHLEAGLRTDNTWKWQFWRIIE